jgi:ABC-type dipeptide/oligopeptide/nickel transport system permease subunit
MADKFQIAAGIVATFDALLVGMMLGMLAGYYGGWVDDH